MNATMEMIKFASMLMQSDHLSDAVTKVCVVWEESAGGDFIPELDDLCNMVLTRDSGGIYDVCSSEIMPLLQSVLDSDDDHEYNHEDDEEDEFDWSNLLETIGEAYDFNFHDSDQTCSHITDMLFDDSVAQTYTIEYVVQQAMKVVGKIVGPLFCDFDFNEDWGAPLPPCDSPGEGCFDWTVRNDSYFQSNDDAGFVVGVIFSYLGGYYDGDNICHHLKYALEDETQLDDMAHRLQASIFRIFQDSSFCSDTIGVISQLFGGDIDIGEIVGFEDTEDFCLTISDIYSQGGDYHVNLDSVFALFGLDGDQEEGEEEGREEEIDPKVIMNATMEMIKFASMLMQSDHLSDAVTKVCVVWEESAGGDFIPELDDLCNMVLTRDSGGIYDVCSSEIMPLLQSVLDSDDDHEYNHEDEDDEFDWSNLLETIGEAYDFNFHDSDQTCSHITDMLFDDSVAQTYTIEYVVQQAMKVVGKIVGPLFCDFDFYEDWAAPLPPCDSPGEGCYDWTMRNNSYFQSNDDAGFVVGVIFSYLGGYYDGDNICHHLKYALEDETQLDDMARRLQASIFRIFQDSSFCSDTIGVISHLIGGDIDIGEIVGFEDTEAFCLTISDIYSQGGDYHVNLDSVFALFGLDGDQEEGEEEEIDPKVIMNATMEMIKFASMLMQSDHLSDAVTKVCVVWEESAGGDFIPELDDLCNMVLTRDSGGIYDVCSSEIMPLLQSVLDSDDDHEYNHEDDEEDEFDWSNLLETIGEAYDFNFHDSDQTCSHITDMLFDDSVAQTYTIEYVVQQAMKVVGKIVGPLFCDFDFYEDWAAPLPPCDSPGEGCYDWTMRNNSYFQSNDDAGFVVGVIFSYLGGYYDGDNICHHLKYALEDETQLDDMARRLQASIFRIFQDSSFCSDTIGVISQLIGGDIDIGEIVGFEDTEDFCLTISDIYSQGGDYHVNLDSVFALFGLDGDQEEGEEEGGEEEIDPKVIMNATMEMIKFASMLMQSDHLSDAVTKVCVVWEESAGGDFIPELDDLCNMVLTRDSGGIYDVCSSEIMPLLQSVLDSDDDHEYNHEDEEDEFDWSNLLETIGEAYDFNFHDSDQTCSHITDMLFDDSVAQTYTIEYVVQQAMKVVGKIVGPLFCDFDLYENWAAPLPPCDSPGEGCYDWTMRNNSYFQSNDDAGFVVGVIFSYLGGYYDGDNICHHLKYALEDETQLDDMARRLQASIFRIFQDSSFCSDTIGVISHLIGGDIDIGEIVGFEDTEDFCLTISDIYSQGGDYHVNLDSVFALFGLDGDQEEGEEEGEEEEIDPKVIMNATMEMIKFASMLMQSDHLSDAVTKVCVVWEESAGGDFIPELDDLCNMVLTRDSGGIYDVCSSEIMPLLQSVLDSDDDHEYNHEDDEEDEFDWSNLLETIGEAYDFNFHDSDQTCSHITDMLFDDSVAQTYTIEYVVQQAMKVVGKIVGPLFCDFDLYENWAAPLPPCDSPGEGCYDWTMRNNSYFQSNDDAGFVVGVIFSYLGGYYDGDNICHHLKYALEDETQLDDMARRLQASIFRIFQDSSFCSDTIGVISHLIGGDIDIGEIVGFEDTEAFCLTISDIYSQGGDYHVNLDSVFALFGLDGDQEGEEEGEEEEIDPKVIMNATMEMIKFASMLMQSDHLSDAVTKVCVVWEESAGGDFIPELDDLCNMVLTRDSGGIYDVCSSEIMPLLQSVLDSDDDHEYNYEDDEEDEFDWSNLLETIGEAYDFNFHDSDQTCSHITDMLFDDSVAQTYTIEYVVQQAMKVVGKIVGPLFCDFDLYENWAAPLPPCDSPGEGCYDWTMRNNSYFQSNDDAGFVVGVIFSYLGGYYDGDNICHHLKYALEDETQLDDMARRLQASIFRIFQDSSFCSDTIGVISQLIGGDIDIGEIVGFEDTEDFCLTISDIYSQGGDYHVNLDSVFALFGLDGDQEEGEEEEEIDPKVIMNATMEMIKFASMLMQSDHLSDAVTKVCVVWEESAGGDFIPELDDLCNMVLTRDSGGIYDVCSSEIMPLLQSVLDSADDHEYNHEDDEEDEFDWSNLLETIGEAYDFNFHDSDQTCSHITDMLFDDSVAQTYTIEYVVQQAMKVVGKIVGPLFCDFDLYENWAAPLPPCDSPGEGCYDWTMRNNSYFQSNDDAGFVVGVIFSYLGGYYDGDNICHHLKYALEDETQLDDMARRLQASIFRIFQESSFCSDTIGVISQLIGGDIDIGEIVGFEDTEDFCLTISDIYSQGGDYHVNLDSVFALFGLDGDQEEGEEEEEEIDPKVIMNATMEMIKFASMLMQSDHLSDAVTKVCVVWEESAGGDFIPELDDLCNMVLTRDSGGIYDVCSSEIMPLLQSVLGESEETESQTGVVDLSTIQICLDDGSVTFEGFENLDILAYLLNTAHKLYNLTVFDADNICRAVTSVVNERKDIPTLLSEFLVEWMTIFMPVGAEICSCWDSVFNVLFAETEEEGFGINQFNELMLIAANGLGFESHEEICKDLISLRPNNMTHYAQHLIDEMFMFVVDPERCACSAREVLDFIVPLVDISLEEINSYIYQYLGFPSVDHVCTFIAYSFSGVSG